MRINKIWKYEYWPFAIFYIPAYFYGLYFAIKARSFTYFTPANPSMRYGGAFDSSKYKYIQHIPKRYLPQSLLVHIEECEDQDRVSSKISNAGIEYPFIIKPDAGERGIGVELIRCKAELNDYFKDCKFGKLLIQEYIDYPIEVGVLYYAYPEGGAGITSLTKKEFLTVTGDGQSSLKELVKRKERACQRLSYLKARHTDIWEEILEDKKQVLLEPIGNHSRGTVFKDGRHLMSDKTFDVFDGIAKEIPGFYYGRFDVRVKSLESLKQGEGLKIIEINGVNSEPTHIYDPNYKIIRAYKDIFFHMKLIYKIAMQNRKRGHKPAPFATFLRDMYQHIRKY